MSKKKYIFNIKHLHLNSPIGEDASDTDVKNIFPFGTYYLPKEVSDFFQNMKNAKNHLEEERDELQERLDNLLSKRN